MVLGLPPPPRPRACADPRARQVVAVLGWHTPLGDGLADEAGRVAEPEHTPCASHPEHAGYPYVLVMVRAERSMHDVSVKERVAGYDLPTVRARPPGAARPSQSIRRGPSQKIS